MAASPMPTPGPLPLTRLMLVPEIAEALACSKDRVYDLFTAGELIHRGAGRCKAAHPLEVQAYLNRATNA